MLFWIGGGLALLVGLVVLVGAMLPVAHQARVERAFPVPPDTIYALISHPDAFPTWRKGVTRVEALTVPGGPVRYREVSGRDAITYEVDEAAPPHRYRTRIADKGLAFGGAWTHEIRATPEGAILRITEDGEVYNPVFRFVSRFIMGHTATLEAYLADVDSAVRRR